MSENVDSILGDQASVPAAAEFARRCRDVGLADTPQRRVIFAALTSSKDHPSAEVLHGRVKERLPRISLATVYRNLSLFVEKGLVDGVATASSHARFDANPHKHHHLICKSCASVTDVYSAAYDALGVDRLESGGFEVQEIKVTGYGLCPRCKTKETNDA